MAGIDAQHEYGGTRQRSAEFTASVDSALPWGIDIEQNCVVANDVAQSHSLLASTDFADVEPQIVERSVERPPASRVVTHNKDFSILLIEFERRPAVIFVSGGER